MFLLSFPFKHSLPCPSSIYCSLFFHVLFPFKLKLPSTSHIILATFLFSTCFHLLSLFYLSFFLFHVFPVFFKSMFLSFYLSWLFSFSCDVSLILLQLLYLFHTYIHFILPNILLITYQKEWTRNWIVGYQALVKSRKPDIRPDTNMFVHNF